jgi:quercetin dioxygenase-like cupin family protein
MIVCLEGSVTVYKRGAEPIRLNSGEMAFIPPAIAHELRNEGKENAAYIFIYARVIQEKEEHDH